MFFFQIGDIGAKDPERAYKLLHFAHGRRNSFATIRLGDYYFIGMGTPKNLKKALEMYENESGIVFAQELGGLDGIAESGLKTTL